ncbi:hypothetical protein N6H14_24595 [Paenibacillus sp. CC-CFT747]|nr:hypothetical protein N6H14_24595 [Paenibacillus sp. CC-CFT747]
MLPAPVDQASIPDPENMASLLGQLGNGASAQTAAEWTSWLAQAKDLLAGMGLLPSSSGSTGEGQAAQGISQEGETAADGTPSAEEGDILSTFLKAFKKEPGSELLQQLASTLQPLVASTMSRVLNPVGGTAASSQIDQGIRLALDKAIPTAADAQESRRAEGNPGPQERRRLPFFSPSRLMKTRWNPDPLFRHRLNR